MTVIVTPLQMARFAVFLDENPNVKLDLARIQRTMKYLASTQDHDFDEAVREQFAAAGGVIENSVASTVSMKIREQKSTDVLDFFKLSPKNLSRDAHAFFYILCAAIPHCKAQGGEDWFSLKLDEGLAILGWPKKNGIPTLSELAQDEENYEHSVGILKRNFLVPATENTQPIYIMD